MKLLRRFVVAFLFGLVALVLTGALYVRDSHCPACGGRLSLAATEPENLGTNPADRLALHAYTAHGIGDWPPLWRRP